MAELVVTQDELALRRRARRRLVGAVAIALTCVVVLPMLFDGEPKPLGPEVDIRIPAQNTPFETAPAAASSAPPKPEPVETRPAEPTQAAAPVKADLPATPQGKAATTPASDKTGVMAEEGKIKADKKLPPVATPPAEKPKPQLKPDLPFAARGYFLQIGAFGSESNARQLRDKAAAAGFKAVLTGANGQFRVRVGPLPQHEKALEMQASLKAKGFSPVLLGP